MISPQRRTRRLKNVACSYHFSANPQDVTCSHWIFDNLSAPAAGRSRAPSLRSELKNCTYSPNVLPHRRPLPAAHLGSRALRKESGFCVYLVTLKRRTLLGGLKIRGILTPACALAQNDRSIGTLSLPSEFQPRITNGFRHVIDTGGTPAQNDRSISQSCRTARGWRS